MGRTPPLRGRRGGEGHAPRAKATCRGEAAGASRRAHPSTPPPALCTGSPTRHRATSPTANGTVVPRAPPPTPSTTLSPTPCKMPPACTSHWLATSYHATSDPYLSTARSRPLPLRRFHPPRNHHRPTPLPPHLWLGRSRPAARAVGGSNDMVGEDGWTTAGTSFPPLRSCVGFLRSEEQCCATGLPRHAT
jgi:hypothetical protein